MLSHSSHRVGYRVTKYLPTDHVPRVTSRPRVDLADSPRFISVDYHIPTVMFFTWTAREATLTGDSATSPAARRFTTRINSTCD